MRVAAYASHRGVWGELTLKETNATKDTLGIGISTYVIV